MAKQYKVGIYCRLSVDDASNSAKAKGYIPSDESVSIENQYEILSKFVIAQRLDLRSRPIRTMGTAGATSSGPDFWKCWRTQGMA